MSSSLFPFSQAPPGRKGMEIAINTLVVMILGILVVGGGIVLVAKLMGGDIDTIGKLSKDKEDALRQMMSDGQLVAITPATQHITGGKSGEFGIGIYNQRDEATNFTISITSSDAAIVAGDPTGNQWNVRHFPTLEVDSHSDNVGKIIVKPGSDVPQQTFTFLVNVTYTDPANPATIIPYETRFFTVRVE